jgi:hypothetical protein
MTAPGANPPAGEWVPVDACTLPTREQPLRLAEIDELFASTLRAVERPPGVATRGRLVLAGGQDLPDRVRRLAAAEADCCSFFSFAVEPIPGDDVTVALDIEVPVTRADVLAGLLDRAERALGGTA